MEGRSKSKSKSPIRIGMLKHSVFHHTAQSGTGAKSRLTIGMLGVNGMDKYVPTSMFSDSSGLNEPGGSVDMGGSCGAFF